MWGVRAGHRKLVRDANHNAFGFAAVPEYDGRKFTSMVVGDIPHTATALSFG